MPPADPAKLRRELEAKAAELGATIRVTVTVRGPHGSRAATSEMEGVTVVELLETALASYQRGVQIC